MSFDENIVISPLPLLMAFESISSVRDEQSQPAFFLQYENDRIRLSSLDSKILRKPLFRKRPYRPHGYFPESFLIIDMKRRGNFFDNFFQLLFCNKGVFPLFCLDNIKHVSHVADSLNTVRNRISAVNNNHQVFFFISGLTAGCNRM